MADTLYGLGQEIRPYYPTWRDTLSGLLMGNDRASPERASLVEGLVGSRGLGSTGMSAADLTGLGAILGLQESAQHGDKAGMALSAIGMVPGAAVSRGASHLAMDTASRMARAAEMGFHTKMPVYHGSTVDFPAFQAVPTKGAGQATPGVSVALDPAVANEFAMAKQGSATASPQVYPLLHRADHPAVLHLDGSETQGEVASTLAHAFDAGHDAVMLKNYTSPAGKSNQNIIIVKDPSQLRSMFAAFDRAKRDSPDLLAGLGGLSIIPAGAFLASQGQQPAQGGAL